MVPNGIPTDRFGLAKPDRFLLWLGRICPEKGFDIAYYDDPKFVGWGGGLPVWKNGELIGAIGVSGLPSVEDIALASLGVELIGDARSA